MRLSSRGNEIKFYLPPYPYEAAAVISFDYETSAQTLRPGIGARARLLYRRAFGHRAGWIQDLSSGYGRGYGNRKGAELVKRLFDNAGINGTWFSTGHALLTGNKSGKSYRINQRLDYATSGNGFGFIEWRKRLKSFYHEPYGDYTSYPYYYLGDLTKSLYENGEDIQSHSFSHPYIPLEPLENLKTDLEDWQAVSQREGYGKSEIFAFPYLGDYYSISKSTRKITLPSKKMADDDYSDILLSADAVSAFRERGFEVFTRCISKLSEELSDDFREYNGTGLKYISSKGLLSFGNSEFDFTEYIDNLSDSKNIVDLWLHPNDILDEEKYKFFETAINIIAGKKNSGILWVPTMKKLWERRKLIGKVAFESEDGGGYIMNNSGSKIENVVMRIKNGMPEISESGKLRKTRSGDYAVDIEPGQKIKIVQESGL